jgi:hypothetical protein
MDDTIGEVGWRFGREPDYERIATRVAVVGSSLEVHEVYVLNGVDISIVVSRLPKSFCVEVYWNERDKEPTVTYLQQETDKLKLYSRIRHTLIHSLVTE